MDLVLVSQISCPGIWLFARIEEGGLKWPQVAMGVVFEEGEYCNQGDLVPTWGMQMKNAEVCIDNIRTYLGS